MTLSDADRLRLPFQLDRPIAFFDLETTGVRVETDRIVELAVLRIMPSGDVLERVRRFNPGIPIPPGATAVHGITDADLADEEPFAKRAKALARMLDPCDLAGFNVRRFDLPLLVAEFKRAGIAFEPRGRRVIDAQQIFHREEPRTLEAAARKYLDREHSDAHTALGDIRTTASVLLAQIEHYPHLPRDLDGLHAYCDEVGPVQTEATLWFIDPEGEAVFRRGKHSGVALQQVAASHADYLRWMLNLDDLGEEVRAIVSHALDVRD
jgi:DNA polymerase-3 subunit epsilon